MWENTRGSETSFLRLQQLVKSRYGKGVKVLPMMEISDRYFTNDSFVSGDDLHVPIIVNQNYLGTAVVSEAFNLSGDEKSSLVETIKLVLEPSLYSRWLKRREENLSEVSKLDFEPADNLVLFNDLEKKYLDVSHQSDNLEIKLISNLIHLHGKNEFFIKRVAYQIHEMSHRWAFLPLQDLNEIKTMEDLLNLGAVTLFVDNIEKLDLEKQTLILKYLESPRSSAEPLFITASPLPLSELKAIEDLSPALLEEITFTCFEVDRAPLSFLELKDILEMMFFENQRS
jgi:hypothetical protein